MGWLDAVADHALRDTLLFVRRSAAPVSAGDAASALGVHRTVARARLEGLVGAGLLEVASARRSGRTGPGAGRPTKLYSAAAESFAMELPARHFPELIGRLAEEVPPGRRARTLRRVGEDYGRTLADLAGLTPADSPAAGFEDACAAMRALGFQAAVQSLEPSGAVISAPTCPLRPLVTIWPEARAIDHGMWAGLVERGIAGARATSVECETRSCLDGTSPCMVVVRLATRAVR